MPNLKFFTWLALAPILVATPTFTDSGSASIQCQYIGQTAPTEGMTKSYTATGTGIDLDCPASDPLYVGPSVSGGAGSLSASVGQGGRYNGILMRSSFDFKSTATDTGLFDGTGPAQVTFTLDWTVGAGNDLTAWENATADFWWNGVEIWSDSKYGYNWEAPPFTTRQIVLTEPIQLGVPFSYQADVEVTGGGNGVGYAKSTLLIEPPADPLPTPEPAYFFPVALAVVLLIRSSAWR